MHALVHRALYCFLRDSHGPALRDRVGLAAGLPGGCAGAGGLGAVDPALTDRLVAVAAAELGIAGDALLEDLGTYLVSHPTMAPMRRLLRYGGICFEDFLHALPDLPDRARLAVPDFRLPAFDLRDDGAGRYRLRLGPGWAGVGPIVIGTLRAMADDYGALVLLGHEAGAQGDDRIGIEVVDLGFASARAFELARPEARG